MRRIGATCAALALAGASASAAATPPVCVTRAQVNDLTLFALPSVLDALADKCRASLPASAYLLNAGHELSRRLSADAGAHWEGAVAVFKTFGDKKMPEGLSPETMRGIMRDILVGDMLKKTTSVQCAEANEGAELLAPLPPENLGRLMGLIVELAGGKKGPKICP
ncbi:MAG: hypothetical protein QOH04_2318 [Sphingomonadales bacterium]|jgi:hypothetical protein|nr:hypothetical protein [Sphingomonadales bacterium]